MTLERRIGGALGGYMHVKLDLVSGRNTYFVAFESLNIKFMRENLRNWRERI